LEPPLDVASDAVVQVPRLLAAGACRAGVLPTVLQPVTHDNVMDCMLYSWRRAQARYVYTRVVRDGPLLCGWAGGKPASHSQPAGAYGKRN